MDYIDPHIHCISRTTDDYLYMARAGVVAVSEPAFWAGFDRSSASSFADYFHHLTNIEPLRAANRLSGRSLYRWSHVSIDGAPAPASNGVSIESLVL